MKKILSLTAIAALVIGITFSGCKKDEEEYTPEALPTATISGKVFCDLDATLDDDQNQDDKVPSGTKLIFSIDAQDLVTDPVSGYAYKTLTYTATVDANGEYTISLPSCGNVITVDIQGVDFNANQLQYDGGVDANGDPTTENVEETYEIISTTADIVEGDVVILDLDYIIK